jgi:hypothetical protein
MSEAKPRRTAIKSIREFCVQTCCAGDMDYVKECPDGVEHQGKAPCPLYPYRMGSNPNISEETKERRRQEAISHGFQKKDCVAP